nr:proline-rich receptor-like protein kinase PERK2 [Chlorocebus sabaeus]
MNRGPQGHQDQVAYIITWEDLVRNPPSWVKPFFHSPSPSQSTLLAVEAPKNQTSDPPKPVLPDGTQQDLLLFDPPPPPPPHNPLLGPPPYASPSSLTLSPIPPTTPSAPTLSPAPSSVPSSTSPPSPTPPKLTPKMPPPSRPPRSLRASGGRKPAPRPAQPRSQPRSRGLRASGGNPRDAVAASAVARKGEVEKVARGVGKRGRAPLLPAAVPRRHQHLVSACGGLKTQMALPPGSLPFSPSHGQPRNPVLALFCLRPLQLENSQPPLYPRPSGLNLIDRIHSPHPPAYLG